MDTETIKGDYVMKKSAGKQMITIAGGILACSIQMMGCYPLAPAYFAAAFLEGVNGVWLTALSLSLTC